MGVITFIFCLYIRWTLVIETWRLSLIQHKGDMSPLCFKKKKMSNWTTWLFFFSSIWHTGYKITYQIFYAFWDNILAMSNPIILVEVILTVDLGNVNITSQPPAKDCVVHASFSPAAVFPVFILLITEYETAYTSCSISVQIVSFLFVSFSLSLPTFIQNQYMAVRKYIYIFFDDWTFLIVSK